MKIRCEGQGVDEKGYQVRETRHKMQDLRKLQDATSFESCNLSSGSGARPIVAIDPRYFLPTKVETLRGDLGKAMDSHIDSLSSCC